MSAYSNPADNPYLLSNNEGDWVPSQKYKYIWEHIPTGKWTFVDETDQFQGVFDTEEKAQEVLLAYAKELNGDHDG